MSAKYSIIADLKSEGWEFAQGVYNELKNKSDDYELNPIEVIVFRDGEIKPSISKNVRGKKCYFIHDSNKEPCRWFTELTFVNQALEKSSAEEIIDVLPYLRFARQDRKDVPRVPISARAVADTIELYAHGVLTLEAHNPANDGFYKERFDNLHAFPTVVKYLKDKYPDIFDNLIILSPDAGGAVRANAFAKRVGITEIAVGYKTRAETGDVAELKILGDVSGKNVLTIDDIVDSGITLSKASKLARKMGAKKIYAYCSHGLFNEGLDGVVSCFDKFFVSDTLKQKKHERLEVISMVGLFAEAIYRMSHGMSLSALFDSK